MLGAWWLQNLESALTLLFTGIKVIVMHSQSTKEGRVEQHYSVKLLTFMKVLLFSHLTYIYIVEEAAQPSVFIMVTRMIAAVVVLLLQTLECFAQLNSLHSV